MWLGYEQNWTWLADIDAWALEQMHRVGESHPGWVAAWNAFCTVLGPNAYRLVALAVVVAALVRRRFRIAVFLVVSVGFSVPLTEVAKRLADRPRPETELVVAHGTSFPSGHAVGVTVGVLALLAIALPVVGDPGRRWLLAFGIAFGIAIGVGRVALNVHHPSDVIAGWALGYSYFVACLLIVPPRVRCDNSPAPEPVTWPDETPAVPDSAR
ncbi:MAG: phosphatase PAP2 family protein [Mycolicibacterium sp.]|uniref:phosphatase PAP2 family protein n=1 Tax=Mycolicibacterium sp. TaxID=2320850 RepID=UPI003D0BBB7C